MASTGDYEIASVFLVDLHWSRRPDIVAAGRFVVMTPTRFVTTIDAYLLKNGTLELWEDDGDPPVDAGGEYSGHPSEDWREMLEPMFAQTLAQRPQRGNA